MKLALFGATGGTGRLVIQQACAAGHEVTAVVRDKARLAQTHPLLTALQVDVMDPTAIGPAIRGCGAVVSTLGPRDVRAPTTVRSRATASIVEAMHAEGVRRLVVVTAAGFTTDGDGPLTRLVIKPILGTVLKHSYDDMRRAEEVVSASSLEWTVVRPPRLTDGPRTGSYRTAISRNVRGGLRISRADLADYILHCLTRNDPLRASIAVGY